MFDVTLDAAGVTSKAKVRSYPSDDRARQTGEATFLSETLDGRTLLYMEGLGINRTRRGSCSLYEGYLGGVHAVPGLIDD
jgi:hypothetical protein